jgi:hypothetical protein
MTDVGLRGGRWLATRSGMRAGGRWLVARSRWLVGTRGRAGPRRAGEAGLHVVGHAWLSGLGRLDGLLGPGDGSLVHQLR